LTEPKLGSDADSESLYSAYNESMYSESMYNAQDDDSVHYNEGVYSTRKASPTHQEEGMTPENMRAASEEEEDDDDIYDVNVHESSVHNNTTGDSVSLFTAYDDDVDQNDHQDTVQETRSDHAGRDRFKIAVGPNTTGQNASSAQPGPLNLRTHVQGAESDDQKREKSTTRNSHGNDRYSDNDRNRFRITIGRSQTAEEDSVGAIAGNYAGNYDTSVDMRARAALGAMIQNRDGVSSRATADRGAGLRRDAAAGGGLNKEMMASVASHKDTGVGKGVDVHQDHFDMKNGGDGAPRLHTHAYAHREHSSQTEAHQQARRERLSRGTGSRQVLSAFPYLARRRMQSELIATGSRGALHVVKFTTDDMRQREYTHVGATDTHVGATDWDMSTEEEDDFVADNQRMCEEEYAQSDDPLSAYRLYKKLNRDVASPESEISTERVYAWQLHRNNVTNAYAHSHPCVENICTINTGVVNVSICPHAVELAVHVLDGVLSVPITADSCMDDLLLVCMRVIYVFVCVCYISL
jgi:hypothetical protein